MENDTNILEERKLPTLVVKQMDRGEQEMQALNEKIQRELRDTIQEVMGLMGLEPSEGWMVDLDSKQFVRIDPAVKEEKLVQG